MPTPRCGIEAVPSDKSSLRAAPMSPRKRKSSTTVADPSVSKKARRQQPPTNTSSIPLSAHELILDQLRCKYDVLTASVLSSTKINKRVIRLVKHLKKDTEEGESSGKPGVALLHCRAMEVCKMITIAENVKSVLTSEGKQWHQYNRLFLLPPTAKPKEGVEEMVLQNAENATASESDDFEIMESRFERAVLPQKPERPPMSLSIYLSTTLIPELKAMDDITVQTSNAGTDK